MLHQERFQQIAAMSRRGYSSIVTRRMSGAAYKSSAEVEEIKPGKDITSSTPDSLMAIYTRGVSSPSDEDCSICMCKLKEPSGFCEDDDKDGSKLVKLLLCSHVYHLVCIKQMVNTSCSHIECPICKTIHGKRIGNQPSGVMEDLETFEALPGFSGCGSIVITYHFVDGIQGPEHPAPGEPYRAYAFPRQAYLPSNEKGKKVLKLLKEAWRRRLVFTIGTSVTTGMKNVITWNEIHHKTSRENFNGHGYPDPDYLDNIILELALQGVTEESI